MKQAYFGLIIGGLWLAWSIYWMTVARGDKAVARVEDVKSRLAYSIPIWVGFGLIVFPRLLRGWFITPLWPPQTLGFVIAVALVVAGLGFTIWARVHLAENWSVLVTVKEGHELIRTGPYGLVRHPIYTGIVTAVLGSAVLMDRPQAFAGFVMLAAGLIVKLRTEENFMEQQFGAAYLDYKSKVKALISGVF